MQDTPRRGWCTRSSASWLRSGLSATEASTNGTREALRNVADAPWGTALLALVTLGLVGYVGWRWVQAFVDPEGDREDSGAKRWLMRAFYFASGVIHGLLAYYGATLVLSSGGGEGGGGAGPDGGSSTWVAELMRMTWGQWLVGALGVGIVIRGLVQFFKAYTESFREKIRTHDLSATQEKWALTAGRIGLTARGVIFGLVGGSIVQAAVTHDPESEWGADGNPCGVIGKG